MNIKETMKKIEKLQDSPVVPWEVMRSGIEPRISGENVILTRWGDADFLTLEEARIVAKWLAEQLGFVVSEPKKKRAKNVI